MADSAREGMTQSPHREPEYIMAAESKRAADFAKVLDSIWATASPQPATREPSLAARLGPSGECQAQGEAR